MDSQNPLEFVPKPTWEDARDSSSGYEHPTLVEHLRAQLNESPPWGGGSEGLYPGNGRLIEFLAAFLRALHDQHDTKSLKIVDFGGGNGYFGAFIRNVLPDLDFSWIVLESTPVVEAYSSVPHPEWLCWMPSSSQHELNCSIFVASCSLNYVQDPWYVLKLAAEQSSHQILMRLPLLTETNSHHPTVQTPVGSGPYRDANASWPAWWFSQGLFDGFLRNLGVEIYRWRSPDETWIFDGQRVALEGRLQQSRE